jgi:tetratricopeptide (TPR) repeat protein
MHPGNVAVTQLNAYLQYVIIVVAVCLCAFAGLRNSRKWVAICLYYGITLLPMLGLIQVGGQWAADRYSYLPALGLSFAWGACVAWTVHKLISGNRSWHIVLIGVVLCCQLAGYVVLTVRQIGFWRTTETLATRVIDLMPHESGAVYLARAMYRNEQGAYGQALSDIGQAMALALKRGHTSAYFSIALEQAVILKNLGRYAEALAIAEWGTQASSGPPPADALQLIQELQHLTRSGAR